MPHDFESLLLLYAFAFDGFLEVTVFTEFGYDVEAVFGAEDILELNDVGVIEPFEEVNLREDCVFEVLVVGEDG